MTSSTSTTGKLSKGLPTLSEDELKKVATFISTIFQSKTASYRSCPSRGLSSTIACNCYDAWNSRAKQLWETTRITVKPIKKRNSIEVYLDDRILVLDYRVFTISTFLKTKTKKYCTKNKILGSISHIFYIKLGSEKVVDIITDLDDLAEGECCSEDWEVVLRFETNHTINKEPALMYRVSGHVQETAGLALMKGASYQVSLVFNSKPRYSSIRFAPSCAVDRSTGKEKAPPLSVDSLLNYPVPKNSSIDLHMENKKAVYSFNPENDVKSSMILTDDRVWSEHQLELCTKKRVSGAATGTPTKQAGSLNVSSPPITPSDAKKGRTCCTLPWAALGFSSGARPKSARRQANDAKKLKEEKENGDEEKPTSEIIDGGSDQGTKRGPAKANKKKSSGTKMATKKGTAPVEANTYTMAAVELNIHDEEIEIDGTVFGNEHKVAKPMFDNDDEKVAEEGDENHSMSVSVYNITIEKDIDSVGDAIKLIGTPGKERGPAKHEDDQDRSDKMNLSGFKWSDSNPAQDSLTGNSLMGIDNVIPPQLDSTLFQEMGMSTDVTDIQKDIDMSFWG